MTLLGPAYDRPPAAAVDPVDLTVALDGAAGRPLAESVTVYDGVAEPRALRIAVDRLELAGPGS